jgi:arabinofuranosyltransferase
VVPAGYVASVRSGENEIADPNLRQYYDHLRLLVQDEALWSVPRLTTIIKMNLGLYNHLLEAYKEAHPEIYQAPVFKSFSEDGG